MSAIELSGYSGHCLYAGFSVSFSNKDGGGREIIINNIPDQSWNFWNKSFDER